MAAGVVLQRGIHDGFEQSCAVVFFVTSSFKDEGFLETEIDHALTQLQDKGKDKFRIITLAFRQGDKKGAVPKILKTYVYKEPVDGLEGLREILKALPIKVGPVG